MLDENIIENCTVTAGEEIKTAKNTNLTTERPAPDIIDTPVKNVCPICGRPLN